MSFLSWNCQGLSSDLTVLHLRDLARRYKQRVIFLMETKNQSDTNMLNHKAYQVIWLVDKRIQKYGIWLRIQTLQIHWLRWMALILRYMLLGRMETQTSPSHWITRMLWGKLLAIDTITCISTMCKLIKRNKVANIKHKSQSTLSITWLTTWLCNLRFKVGMFMWSNNWHGSERIWGRLDRCLANIELTSEF